MEKLSGAGTKIRDLRSPGSPRGAIGRIGKVWDAWRARISRETPAIAKLVGRRGKVTFERGNDGLAG
jgi:hypothetical protein